ncbi:hypothetical protein NC651_025379 [Populus alba x Populus x berolinensis]|nr:hypothetical protein NC651_025379 [Populus alba x Populus x berolinensis]
MQAIQDLLEVLHQSEMVTTAAGRILQLMAMAMILMKMAMGLARNRHMILRKRELGGRHLVEHQGHLLDQDLGRLTCHQGILDKANECARINMVFSMHQQMVVGLCCLWWMNWNI